MIPLSTAAAGIVQSEIRVMSVECEKVGGVNLAQGVCDTEAPLPVSRRTRSRPAKRTWWHFSFVPTAVMPACELTAIQSSVPIR